MPKVMGYKLRIRRKNAVSNYVPIPLSLVENIACDMRHDILKMVYNCGKENGHLGGCMSAVEVLAVLYTQIMNINEVAHSDRDWSERDRFIMSKGHAGIAMYAAMKHVGLVSQEMISGPIRGETAILYRHPKRNIGYGIECSVGSLGMGLGYGNGLQESFRRRGTNQRVFVMIGDGECSEGSVWESAAYASHRKLDNITVIVDMNKLQLDGPTHDILSMDNMAERWTAFGFKTVEVDGHDIEAIYKALQTEHVGQPLAVIAHTIKGKGISFAENKTEWHDNYLSDELYEKGIKELGGRDLSEVKKLAAERFETRRIKIKGNSEGQVISIPDTEEQILSWQSYGIKNAIGEVSFQLAEQDELFTLIYSDCANRIGIKSLHEKYPEKCYEAGIAEQNQIVMAAAMAHEGFHVFAVAYAPFITARVLDQIRVNLGYMKAPVCLIGLSAGMAGSDLGATHTAFEDIANTRSIPNILVTAPADTYEMVKGMEYFVNNPRPMYLRVTVGEDTYFKPVAYSPLKADVIRRGKDIALVAVGILLKETIKAAEILHEKGIEATVINARTVKPLDEEMIETILFFETIVTIEEHSVIGGLGSAVAEKLAVRARKGRLHMVGVNDEYFYGEQGRVLFKKNGLAADGIVESILHVIRQVESE